MSQRFFVEQPIVGPEVVLEGPEAKHLTQVLRAKKGDRVTLFDGLGSEFTARIEHLERNRLRLKVESESIIDRELGLQWTIGAALPKGDRQRWMIEKLVELGTTRFVPLTTARAVTRPGTRGNQKLQRYVVEASKQCGRNRLMSISESMTLAQFLREPGDDDGRWFAHTDGSGRRLATLALSVPPAAQFAAIGPEGGWSNEEVSQAVEYQWRLVDLGVRTLRLETSVVMLAAWVAAVCSSREP